MSKTIKIELTESELSMLVTVLHMGGWHKKKDYPERMQDSDNKFIRKMSKVMKKLEAVLEDD